MQVPAPMIWIIQQLIDTALTMDPQVREQLNPLDQKVIEIDETGLGLSVFLMVVDQTVQILGIYDGKVDTTLRGNAVALLSLSRDTKGLFTGDVAFEGDLEVGKAARGLIASLDIDWEEQLSKVTGDSIAHQVGRLHRSFFKAISRTGTELTQDASEYLTEETDMLTNPQAVSAFLSEIDSLRDDAERLEARITLLEDKLERH